MDAPLILKILSCAILLIGLLVKVFRALFSDSEARELQARIKRLKKDKPHISPAAYERRLLEILDAAKRPAPIPREHRKQAP